MAEERIKRYVNSIPIVAKRFKVGKVLGWGSFGVICEGKNIAKGEPVAMKFELKDEENQTPQLPFEFLAFDKMNKKPGKVGVPKIYYFKDIPGMPVHCLIMELLGPSLEQQFNKCDRQFSTKTTILIALQMIDRIEHCHRSGIINRDVKPDNFLLGRPGTSHARTIYMIDFGLCKPYLNSLGQHIPMREGLAAFGTLRYMSVNCHNRITLSRRDDLESMAYTIIYFHKGELPWQGINGDQMERDFKIGEIKRRIIPEKLCDGMPEAFCKCLKYIKALEFSETPDYNFLIKVFKQAYRRGRFKDELFDWEM